MSLFPGRQHFVGCAFNYLIESKHLDTTEMQQQVFFKCQEIYSVRNDQNNTLPIPHLFRMSRIFDIIRNTVAIMLPCAWCFCYFATIQGFSQSKLRINGIHTYTNIYLPTRATFYFANTEAKVVQWAHLALCRSPALSWKRALTALLRQAGWTHWTDHPLCWKMKTTWGEAHFLSV